MATYGYIIPHRVYMGPMQGSYMEEPQVSAVQLGTHGYRTVP